jgi:hypothetical protein
LLFLSSLDQDHEDIQYLGSILPLSSRDVITGNEAWSPDSHPAALAKIKRPLGDVEGDDTDELPKQRRRIRGRESSMKVSISSTLYDLNPNHFQGHSGPPPAP